LVSLLSRSRLVSLMSRGVKFYYPIPYFPSVSITGAHCDLKCSHCRGHYLQQMSDTSTPEKLREFCVRHEEKGGLGLLISGGSTRGGRVPLSPFLDTIRWVKDHTDLILNLHTGMLNKQEAEEVASTGVDVVSVDVVGSEETLKTVYGLNVDLDTYSATLTHLVDAGVNVAPHICVGIQYGEVLGEYKALELAAEVNPETVVIISLIPTENTPMANIEPPSVKSVTEIIKKAVKTCRQSEISLGCMRSRSYKTELEWAAIEAGAKRIAIASRSTLRRAADAGYEVHRFGCCCATPARYESALTI